MPGIGADEIFRIGGLLFSRTSAAIKVEGVPYTGIFDIAGEESREGEYIHGQRTDGTPLGMTSGLYLPDSLTFKAYVDTALLLEEQLAAIGLGSFGNALWTLSVEIFENVSLPTIQLAWSKVKIEKRKAAIPTDTGALANEYTCKFLSFTGLGEGVGLAGLPQFLANLWANL
jgi:hypothetical protein